LISSIHLYTARTVLLTWACSEHATAVHYAYGADA